MGTLTGCHQVPKSPQLWDLYTSITNQSIASVSKQNQHYLQSLFIKYLNEFITSNDNIFYKHMTLLVYATTIDSLSLQCNPSHHPHQFKGVWMQHQPWLLHFQPPWLTQSLWGASSIITNAVYDVPCHMLAVNTITVAGLTYLLASLLQGSYTCFTSSVSPASISGRHQEFPISIWRPCKLCRACNYIHSCLWPSLHSIIFYSISFATLMIPRGFEDLQVLAPHVLHCCCQFSPLICIFHVCKRVDLLSTCVLQGHAEFEPLWYSCAT